MKKQNKITHFSISDPKEKHPALLAEDDSFNRPIHGFVFILILRGKGTIRINGKDHAIRKGMLLSITPFHSYGLTERSSDFIYEYVSFLFDFMANFPLLLNPVISERMEKNPCLLLPQEEFALLNEYHSHIVRHYNRTAHPSRLETVKASLFIFVSEINYIYSQQFISIQTTHQEQITNDFIKLLHISYKKERKPEYYAQKLCLTPKHLSKVIKEVTGQTLYTWICEFVIKEARILLQSTDLSVAQISDELNFPSSSYFARYFRKYTGLSPMEYRLQHP